MLDFLKPAKTDPFKVRRNLAIQAFYSILFAAVLVVLFVMVGNKGMIERINAVQFIIAAILASLTGLVTHYVHSIHAHKKLNKGEDDAV